MKTADLTGKALNWAVLKCEGLLGSDRVYISNSCTIAEGVLPDGVISAPESVFDIDVGCVHYDTDWAQGGPIIERENISVAHDSEGWQAMRNASTQSMFGLGGDNYQFGATPLIAAMRCYVASKLGDEVEIPHDLTN